MSEKLKAGDLIKNLDNDEEYIVIDNKSGLYFNLYNEYDEYDLDSTDLIKEKAYKVVSGKVDSYDGYVILKGKKVEYIIVGCRVFRSLKAAKQHWANNSSGYHFQYEVPVPDDTRMKKNTKRYKLTQKLVARAKEKV